ncbi:hypothetical protein AMS57_14285 [Pseudoalteromonas undina]|uniref:hypothetical protein n=1 Tax=Pseudoalteromonas undina TaxID=43660 RepID=UPI0006BA88DC|nr:hypothetical protein [Pseudoalteromonas undina]KPH89845.1 hypothetical protein AMS57_14285 [Pseudoalteromonas undina]
MRILVSLLFTMLSFLMFSTNILAQDYFAPKTWDITDSFTIDSGDRMYVTANSKVTLEDSAKLIINKGAELIIEQGVSVFAGRNASIDVRGTLISTGVEGSEVVFTSSLDIPEKGSWNGIYAYNGSNVTLRYTQVKYASWGVYEVSISSATHLDIQYSLFEQNTQAIYINESTRDSGFISTIHYNSFIDNTTNLYANVTYGNSDSTIIDARIVLR